MRTMDKPSTIQLDLHIAPSSDGHSDSICVLERNGRVLLERKLLPIDLHEFEDRFLSVLKDHVYAELPLKFLDSLGSFLGTHIFSYEFSTIINDLLKRRIDASDCIRLSLRVDSSGFKNIPWEYVNIAETKYNSSSEPFLALNRTIHLVRSVSLIKAAEPINVNPLRVLLVSANPKTSSYPDLLNLEDEIKSIVSALHHSGSSRAQCTTLRDASRHSIEQAIHREKPHILHFMGHGDMRPTGGVLILHGNNGEDTLYGDELAEWLAEADTRLVVLSACNTSSAMKGAAESLSKGGVAAVVAMQLPIRDSSAALFARAFYGAVAEPVNIEEAVYQGRQAIRGMGADWGVPILYLGVSDSQLFKWASLESEPLPPTNIPYPRNPQFLGRERELLQLHQFLSGSNSGAAVVGMAGLGKTQIAVEYGHSRRLEYTGGIFWLNAQSTSRLMEEYASIGRFFNIPEDLPVEVRAQRTRDILQREVRPTLVIYDNLEEETHTSLLITAGNCSRIITARSRSVIPASYSLQQIDDLDGISALHLLQSKVSADNEGELEAAQAIVKLLGRLPLALALAAHHIGRLHLTFTEYLSRLTQNLSQELEKARRLWVNSTGHSGELFDLIELTYRSLSVDVRNILEIASCFDSRGISPELLYCACLPCSRNDYEEALADLENNCYILRETDKRLSIHELLRVFVHQEMKKISVMTSCVEKSANVLILNLKRSNEQKLWKDFYTDIVHCRISASLCRASDLQCQLYHFLIELGTYTLEHCDGSAAQEHYAEAKQVSGDSWGRISIQSATAQRYLAESIQDGDKQKALDYAREALVIAEQTISPEDSEMAEFHCTLGFILKMMVTTEEGSLDLLFEARQHYDKALDINLKYFGRQHQKVASCLNYIGMLLVQDIKLGEALSYLQEALEIDQKVFGQQSVQVAIRLNNIGTVLRKKQDWEEAVLRHKEALQIYSEAYGERFHQDIADSLYYIGDCLEAEYSFADAQIHFADALTHYDFIYGSQNNRSTITKARIEVLKKKFADVC